MDEQPPGVRGGGRRISRQADNNIGAEIEGALGLGMGSNVQPWNHLSEVGEGHVSQCGGGHRQIPGITSQPRPKAEEDSAESRSQGIAWGMQNYRVVQPRFDLYARVGDS
jgi:hypothetical protein